jgi:hypothetical protein
MARPLVDDFWNNNDDIKMKDFAELGYCIIKYNRKKMAGAKRGSRCW